MKSHLLEVENYFIHLIDLLRTQASNGFKLTAIYEFLNILLLRKDYSKFVSYYSDLAPYIEYIINEAKFEGLSPIFLTDYQLIIDKLSIFDLFKNKIELLKILEEGKKNIFNPIEKDLLYNCIPIILIEENSNQGFRLNPKFAVIKKLYIHTTLADKEQNEDKIEFKNIIDLRETGIIDCLKDSIKKVKVLCNQKGIKVHNYNFTFYFDSDQYIYTGSSLQLAATSLAFNSILLTELNNQYYKFRNDCVMTGALDDDGNVMKMDTDILELKIKGVFFSGYSKMILPEDNFADAIEILKSMKNIYPEKNLEIIPIKKADNIFTNLEIVERFDLKILEKLKARYKKYNVAVNWVLSLLLIIFILLATVDYVIPRLDRNPIEYNYLDNHYSIFNKYGIEIWRSKILSDINREYYYDQLCPNSRCLLTDVDSNNINELIYLVRDYNDNDESRSIFCSNPEIKLFPFLLPIRTLNYPNDPIDNYNYYIKGIVLIDCNADNREDILFWGLNSKYYPGIIGAIDFNGNIIAEYWNEGHTTIVKVFDIDGYGNKEIFVGGCNNRDSIECAALIVFNPYYISGSSPYTNPLSNNKKGLEKYYIIFPKSIILKYTRRERNNVQNINYNINNTISCWTFEGEISEDLSICYQFDKDLNLLRVDCNDKFKNAYEKLIKEKNLDLPDIQTYLNNLKSEVKWWNGDYFSKNPSTNRHYLEAINR
ncbi:MAG: hypothetical protein N2490_04760 [Ignavibacteria bacterium]|nr:hypothetical protein [Ignavibacteria bacterium]